MPFMVLRLYSPPPFTRRKQCNCTCGSQTVWAADSGIGGGRCCHHRPLSSFVNDVFDGSGAPWSSDHGHVAVVLSLDFLHCCHSAVHLPIPMTMTMMTTMKTRTTTMTTMTTRMTTTATITTATMTMARTITTTTMTMMTTATAPAGDRSPRGGGGAVDRRPPITFFSAQHNNQQTRGANGLGGWEQIMAMGDNNRCGRRWS